VAALSRGAAAALVVAALWAVLTLARPGVTFHLAPLLTAIAPAALTRYECRVPAGAAVAAGGAGLAIALLATAALGLAGRLGGPSLLPTGGATLESAVFAVVGAIAGVLIAWPWPRPASPASRGR
jgi:hypothetical protein